MEQEEDDERFSGWVFFLLFQVQCYIQSLQSIPPRSEHQREWLKREGGREKNNNSREIVPASDTGELDTALHLHTSGNTLKNFKFKVSLRLCWIGNFAHTSADDSACAKKRRELNAWVSPSRRVRWCARGIQLNKIQSDRERDASPGGRNYYYCLIWTSQEAKRNKSSLLFFFQFSCFAGIRHVHDYGYMRNIAPLRKLQLGSGRLPDGAFQVQGHTRLLILLTTSCDALDEASSLHRASHIWRNRKNVSHTSIQTFIILLCYTRPHG